MPLGSPPRMARGSSKTILRSRTPSKSAGSGHTAPSSVSNPQVRPFCDTTHGISFPIFFLSIFPFLSFVSFSFLLVGKTNTPIFGTQAFSDNLLFGPARNPWNLSKTPGGSSGGSAAIIAGRIAPLVTAADGGGSIRIPATFVGAFGLKPTFGRVPCDEMKQFGMAKILHCVHFGPLTRSVEDAALYLDLTCGYHPLIRFRSRSHRTRTWTSCGSLAAGHVAGEREGC